MRGQLDGSHLPGLLRGIARSAQSGELLIEDGQERGWSLLFAEGRPLAASAIDSLEALHDYASSLAVEVERCVGSPPVLQLIERGGLAPDRAEAPLRAMAAEVLFELLGSDGGTFCFDPAVRLPPVGWGWDLETLLIEADERLSAWRPLRALLMSLDVCPRIVEAQKLQQSVSAPVWQQLSQWLNGEYSLRRLGRFLGRDAVAVGEAIAPYLAEGWIELTGGAAAPPVRSGCIGCIDSSLAVQKYISSLLAERGYSVQAIAHPFEAFERFAGEPPALILLAAELPWLSGYELCPLLRQKPDLRTVPIVLLTAEAGALPDARARIAGASAVLAKPFSGRELNEQIEKFLPAVFDPLVEVAA